MNEFSYINIIELLRIIFLGSLWFILVSRIIKEESEVRKMRIKRNPFRKSILFEAEHGAELEYYEEEQTISAFCFPIEKLEEVLKEIRKKAD